MDSAEQKKETELIKLASMDIYIESLFQKFLVLTPFLESQRLVLLLLYTLKL
jgi:hypothetical protein